MVVCGLKNLNCSRKYWCGKCVSFVFHESAAFYLIEKWLLSNIFGNEKKKLFPMKPHFGKQFSLSLGQINWNVSFLRNNYSMHSPMTFEFAYKCILYYRNVEMAKPVHKLNYAFHFWSIQEKYCTNMAKKWIYACISICCRKLSQWSTISIRFSLHSSCLKDVV